ncbi:hypothetical protein ACFTAO_46520 [Paenibacillus rhizoplanae]
MKKGQRLILYDSQSAEAGLQDEIALLDKQKLGQQTLQDQFIQTYAEGDELQIRKARREIEAGKQDQARQARKIAEMRDRLTAEQQLKAPFDGIVTRLNALPGILSSGEPDLVLSSSREGFQFDFTADAGLLSSLGITLGEKLEVEVHSAEGPSARILAGKITEIKSAQARAGSPAGEDNSGAEDIAQKTVFIVMKEGSLQGGEQVQFQMKKPSLQEGVVVPAKAIHQTGGRSFVYVVEEQRGGIR